MKRSHIPALCWVIAGLGINTCAGATATPATPELFGTREQCVSYPALAGFHWPRDTIEAFCADEFTAALGFKEIRSLIEAGKGKELDERLSHILTDYLSGKLPEGTARYAYDNFNRADDATGKLIDSWLAQSPGSAYALAARGIHHYRRGADARGSAFIKDTPPEDLERMRVELNLAKPDLVKATTIDNRILYAYSVLIDIARLSGNRALGADALARALRVDPQNFYVRATYSNSCQPRWGGSFDAMDKVAADAKPWLKKNPRLANLREMALAHRGFEDYAEHRFDAALKLYELGLAEGPNGFDLYMAGTMAAKLNRHKRAIELFDQALRFSPRYADVRRHRASSHIKLEMYDAAQVDLEVVLEDSPQDSWSLGQYGYLLLKRKDYNGAFVKLDQANKIDPSDAWVTERLAWLYVYKKRSFKEAQPLVAQLLEKNPKNGAAWLMRADLIQNIGGAGLHEAAENFVRFADPSDDDQRVALPKVKAWLASHPEG